MRKLLSLIGTIGLVLNSSVTSIILLNDSEENNQGVALISVADENVNKELIVSAMYKSPIETIKEILSRINSETLLEDDLIILLEGFLKSLNERIPEVVEYLSYLKFSSSLPWIINELANDWNQQADYGNTPIAAMRNFINTDKGDIAQAKREGNTRQWHYVDVRAQEWSWNDFYQYMAGANMNYMFKILSHGNYLGDLIAKHLHTGPLNWGFEKDDFLNDVANSIAKLPTTKEAWPYLIKAILPMIKAKVLNLANPILGFKNLTWEQTNNQDLSLKDLLTELKYLLSSEGYSDLVNIITSILTGPFAEDLIIYLGIFGYYTFPESLEVGNTWPINEIIGDDLKPEVLAKLIVDELLKVTNNLDLVGIFANVLDKVESVNARIENPVVDLKNLAFDLNKLYQTNNFQDGLEQLIDFIRNPETTQVSLSEIFKLWGAQKTEVDFKIDSPLFIIKKLIDDPNSILNQVLNILIELDKKKNSI